MDNSVSSINIAIIGTGHIATDLLLKLKKEEPSFRITGFIGIDPHSDGLNRAKKLGYPTFDKGLLEFARSDLFMETDVFLDASSAKAHSEHQKLLLEANKRVIDLTPCAIGTFYTPYIDTLHFEKNLQNINLITCGGQATVPIIYACSQISVIPYAEIVSTIASASAGLGTRANIDEFTQTTSLAIQTIGGAQSGKAIIILNPAKPDIMMRNTIHCILDKTVNTAKVTENIHAMAHHIQQFVPGYKIVNGPIFEPLSDHAPYSGIKMTVFIEVTGAQDYFPKYAGNLDIMTASAVASLKQLI